VVIQYPEFRPALGRRQLAGSAGKIEVFGHTLDAESSENIPEVANHQWIFGCIYLAHESFRSAKINRAAALSRSI
jgi:hypothetical protein